VKHPQFSHTKLKLLRREAGLSRRQLAEACTVARSTVAEYEQGRYSPSAAVLAAAAAALRCSVADFFEEVA
jgi:transcriptional regulator with XRE-family HTH domain